MFHVFPWGNVRTSLRDGLIIKFWFMCLVWFNVIVPHWVLRFFVSYLGCMDLNGVRISYLWGWCWSNEYLILFAILLGFCSSLSCTPFRKIVLMPCLISVTILNENTTICTMWCNLILFVEITILCTKLGKSLGEKTNLGSESRHW